MNQKLSICVYCGSRSGVSPAYVQAAQQVGQWLGSHQIRLVYGGGNAGLMGTVANAALAAGGEVYGIIPQSLIKKEQGHRGITELRIVDTMHQRKQAMAQASDAFLALPGGIGTFEEFFEVWTWRQLAYHDNPIGLLNVDGYYDGLLNFMQTGVNAGFMNQEQLSYLTIESQVEPMMEKLTQLMQQPSQADSYHAI
ncbi:Cytokinin riboside 5'-monophosphate phosphoribohydrolase [Saezia sanguinis]|uniref:Cytokinin riboside 5'-monophosphate phosphoribohydrolase n=1 Tax=Saezia sanguinis TaxID=1965230 RepID=A0A433SFS1_9BURK|nr:TIGR00730 family Rossman fold protein [Saezia sanguinis]RUS67593.1 Cytokinin riboside 5'-monophosphate phosphoribohydrolase [Saezia sanguinis]